jgi:1-acyl-sn-glycerol-3-phosphate acyltransferase
MFKRDPFGHLIFIKRILISLIGWLTWARYNSRNKTQISGTAHLSTLPRQNVLFVSNHQTYFADVIAMLHVFCAVKNGHHNSLRRPWYLFRPKVNNYFVAAVETMKKGFLPRIFAYVGSVSIERTWKAGEENINRKLRMEDLGNISKALEDGWVINFPQGTTKVNAPGRRGVALLVKKYNPIVIPVVIDGFNLAFDKTGIRKKGRNVNLSIRFKAPLHLNPDLDGDTILAQIMEAIEQAVPKMETIDAL